ncbi:MAG: hypothetical protein JWM76_2866 [Pseudonocardiales bacterium]|nr:hypothetical protein [Pseudonocardiales bacterium]
MPAIASLAPINIGFGPLACHLMVEPAHVHAFTVDIRGVRFTRAGAGRSLPAARPQSALVQARATFLLVIRIVASTAFVLIALCAGFAAWGAGHLVHTPGAQHLVTGLLLAVILAPILAVSVHLVVRQVRSADAVADVRQRHLDDESRHRELDSNLADALEMADTEDEALRVIERAFVAVLPSEPVELLLADNSHAHLTRRATTAPNLVLADCPVGSPQECPAARRARVHHFSDSEAVNACPKLAGREQGRCSALCIPVSVMGRTVGVIHSVQKLGDTVDGEAVRDLQSIAHQAGARLGLLRVMAETQAQASTDALTGLMNRRAFENGFLTQRNEHRTPNTVIAMADLDHFKTVNDTYGHETGDRALRVFAETLRATMRVSDLISRRGGEEFTILFPDCQLPAAVAALERVRIELDTAIRRAGLPRFTASFGIVPVDLDEDLDVLLTRADKALFEAKHNGRDQVVAHPGLTLP